MSEASSFEKLCPECGTENNGRAERCASCGHDLMEDVELSHVDPDRRVELTRFESERGDEAELACGLLRAKGIACELSATALPGLPAALILWVNPQDARPALALLENAHRGLSEEDEAA